MNIKKFIKKHGASKLAREMGVNYRTVWQWSHYIRCPDHHLMRRLVKRYKLSYEEIIEPYLDHHGKR